MDLTIGMQQNDHSIQATTGSAINQWFKKRDLKHVPTGTASG